MDISLYLDKSDIPLRIYRYHELKASDWRRDHLGASQIGKPCRRELWYSFRWVKAIKFDGRMLRLFETGNFFEPRIIRELGAIGIKVYGEQKYMSILPHFGGSCDGIGEGFTESSVPHVLEFKTHSRKSWEEVSAKGVSISKPQHYAQMQCYMGALKINRAYYIAVNKDTDELYAERLKFNTTDYEIYKAKAYSIIHSPTPLEKIADNPARFECRFCDYKAMCHSQDKPEVNCRTCIHSTPEDTGKWSCAAHGGIVPPDFQREGCKDHLFIPHLLNREVTGTTDDSITYDNGWTNRHNSKEYTV